MSNVFFISDNHFGHANILKFDKADGSPLRRFIDKEGKFRRFSSVEEMDEHMIDSWNKVVRDYDVVYHLGDFSMGKNPGMIASRLKGQKRLVRGNHDGHKLAEYARHFKEIYGARHLQRCWLTHIPIHPGSIRGGQLNLHGHLHYAQVMDGATPDLRYFNVSVERIDYTPIPVEEVRQITGVHIL